MKEKAELTVDKICLRSLRMDGVTELGRFYVLALTESTLQDTEAIKLPVRDGWIEADL